MEDSGPHTASKWPIVATAHRQTRTVSRQSRCCEMIHPRQSDAFPAGPASRLTKPWCWRSPPAPVGANSQNAPFDTRNDLLPHASRDTLLLHQLTHRPTKIPRHMRPVVACLSHATSPNGRNQIPNSIGASQIVSRRSARKNLFHPSSLESLPAALQRCCRRNRKETASPPMGLCRFQIPY